MLHIIVITMNLAVHAALPIYSKNKQSRMSSCFSLGFSECGCVLCVSYVICLYGGMAEYLYYSCLSPSAYECVNVCFIRARVRLNNRALKSVQFYCSTNSSRKMKDAISKLSLKR